jgi:hypothetical protein
VISGGTKKENPQAVFGWGAAGFHFCGEGGIRTLGTGLSPYNGLANRPFRPLRHLSMRVAKIKINCFPATNLYCKYH